MEHAMSFREANFVLQVADWLADVTKEHHTTKNVCSIAVAIICVGKHLTLVGKPWKKKKLGQY